MKQPRGILTAPVSADADGTRAYGTLQAVNSGDAATIKADGLINLQYSLKPEYRANACWLMNSATLAVVRRLKDSTGAACGNRRWPFHRSCCSEALSSIVMLVDLSADVYPVARRYAGSLLHRGVA